MELPEKSKYNSLQEWKEARPWAYKQALRNGYLDEFCEKLGWERDKLKNGYWTKEKCIQEAKRFSSIKEWRKNSESSYQTACRNKWNDECAAHLTRNLSKPWTLERCIIDARSYTSKRQWDKNSSGAYQAARVNGWLQQCCGHMTSKRHKYWNLELCLHEAQKYATRKEWESSHKASYSASRKYGWYRQCVAHMVASIRVISKSQEVYWTFDRCLASAKKYTNRTLWFQHEVPASRAARTKGWLQECCAHMTKGKKANGFWTLEKCIEEAKKYKTLSEWIRKSGSSHQKAMKKGWISACSSHMTSPQKPSGYWTLERCKEDSMHFTSRTLWARGSNSAYLTAQRNNWLDQCCEHMRTIRETWTFEKCHKRALRYVSKAQFEKNDSKAYRAAYKNGWLNKCCAHMKNMRPE